jgi:hypothetical protein
MDDVAMKKTNTSSNAVLHRSNPKEKGDISTKAGALGKELSFDPTTKDPVQKKLEQKGISLEGQKFEPLRLPNGRYDVTLTIKAWNQSEKIKKQIEVKDILIVALGDSYIAGEGNPEKLLSRTVFGSVSDVIHLSPNIPTDPAIRSLLISSKQFLSLSLYV